MKPYKPTIREQIEGIVPHSKECIEAVKHMEVVKCIEADRIILIQKLLALLSPQTGSEWAPIDADKKCNCSCHRDYYWLNYWPCTACTGYHHDVRFSPQTGEGEKTCANCGWEIDGTQKRDFPIDAVELGRRMYHQILDGRYRSIDLCGFCYSILSAYRHSEHPIPPLSEEMEIPKEWIVQYGTGDMPQSHLSEPLVRCTLAEMQAFLRKQLDLQEKRILEEHKSGIWSRKDIRGGVPCMFGTRIPVSLVEELLNDGQTPEFVAACYPQLSIWSIEKVRSKLSSKK